MAQIQIRRLNADALKCFEATQNQTIGFQWAAEFEQLELDWAFLVSEI